MRKLQTVNFGTEVQGVRLQGNPKNPEPEIFRVAFPGGDVDVTRTTNNEYWVHIRVNTERDIVGNDDLVVGKLVDARLDIEGKHASETNAGDFADPKLYHLAVRIRADSTP